jgi:hypothetical protein
MKMTAFWAMMEAEHTSETSVNFNDTSHRYIPEGCHIHKLMSLQ